MQPTLFTIRSQRGRSWKPIQRFDQARYPTNPVRRTSGCGQSIDFATHCRTGFLRLGRMSFDAFVTGQVRIGTLSLQSNRNVHCGEADPMSREDRNRRTRVRADPSRFLLSIHSRTLNSFCETVSAFGRPVNRITANRSPFRF